MVAGIFDFDILALDTGDGVGGGLGILNIFVNIFVVVLIRMLGFCVIIDGCEVMSDGISVGFRDGFIVGYIEGLFVGLF